MTEDVLKTIEDCGAAEMPVADTCIIAEISPEAFAADPEALKRYRRGQLLTKFETRKAIIKLAKAGNPQMVKEYADFARENQEDALVRADPYTAAPSGGEFDGI